MANWRPPAKTGGARPNPPVSAGAAVAEAHEGAVEKILDARCGHSGQHGDVRHRLIVPGETEEELPVVGQDGRADAQPMADGDERSVLQHLMTKAVQGDLRSG